MSKGMAESTSIMVARTAVKTVQAQFHQSTTSSVSVSVSHHDDR